MPLKRLLGIWVLACGAMILNGIFREVLLVPAAGRSVADVMSAGLGVIILLALSWAFLHGPSHAMTVPQQLTVAASWLLLTVVFEFTFGHWVDGKSWQELLDNYNVSAGRLWPIVLGLFVITPFLFARSKARQH